MKRHRWMKWKTCAWSARPIGAYPNVIVEVGPENSIEIFVSEKPGQTMEGFRVPRRLARLAAKRINECLDDTE